LLILFISIIYVINVYLPLSSSLSSSSSFLNFYPKGGSVILKTFKGNFNNALMQLFPEIGFDSSKFRHVASMFLNEEGRNEKELGVARKEELEMSKKIHSFIHSFIHSIHSLIN
jgi:hypothetical protein